MKQIKQISLEGESPILSAAIPKIVKNCENFYWLISKLTMCKKCPNTEFFLVRIQENTDQKNYVFGHFSFSVKIKLKVDLGSNK